MLDLSREYPYFWFRGHGMQEDVTLPDIDRGYRELRPLFFGALGLLARQGFVTPPADGLDLIHDFFADEWANLQRTYDPSRGNYKAYVYRAFVQFVRPRIVRMQRLQNYKVRPDEVDTAMRETPAAETSETSYDDELVRSKIAELPELQREILTAYVYSDKVSERVLARKYCLSRYRLRELLLEALGRVLVQLDRPNGISSGDWQVALALWRDARSIDETAKYLAITQHQVRAANKRNFAFLTRVLSIYHPHNRVRSLAMPKPKQKPVYKAGALFKEALLSPNNQELLRMVEQRAGEIMKACDRPDEIDLSEDQLKNLDPLWVSEVYKAVAPKNLSAAAGEMCDLVYAHAEEEAQIGLAYKLSLIPGLPEHLADLSGQWLVKVPPVAEDEMQDVLKSPSAVAAQPLSDGLARYGVAPLTVLDATDAVARLVERCVRSGMVSGEEAIVLSSHGANDGEVLNTQILTNEVSRVAECREPTARVLLDWSIEVARFKPLLFNGFTAESSGPEALMLTRTGEKFDDLHQRWGRSVSGTVTEQRTFDSYFDTSFRMET
jgi:DNA-directed RNA polymerase specialized sigma24 family protein